jgi:crotonobetainyl-CoA:carnitine CoA-transferase CaiB-like acyl-CoA transferase
MRVIDLSADVAGRFAAKLFVMAGIDVYRPGAAPAPDSDPLDRYLDAGKIALPTDNATDPPAIVTGADLVFVSFDQGRLCGMAPDFAAFPQDCVVVTTSSFGATGPYAAYRGGPISDWASGGYLYITGDPDREPLMGPDHMCSYIAGYTAAMVAEAALIRRQSSGQGAQLDVSTMETMAGLHQSTFARAAGGILRERTGRYAEVYPLTVLPCRDGYVSLAIVTDDEFDHLAIAIGRPELAADPRFGDRAGRMANRDALDAELDLFLGSHDAEAIVELLQANAVPSARVEDAKTILDNPQLASRNFWASPDGNERERMPGNPVRASVPPTGFSATPPRESPPPLPRADKRSPDLPLQGMVVLDLTAFWAGPSATRCLADLGADVIWVERPRGRIDVDRNARDAESLVAGLYHEKMNRHKRSIVLDLYSEEGRRQALALACRADVVVENFRPGVASRLGLGPQALCSINPQLIYVSLSGFGSAGPWGNWRSFGPNIEAASSILSRTGYPGEGPMRLGHALPDGVGGIVGALAALRGLRERAETGHGGWFDLSQLESYVALSGEEILAASIAGAPAPRKGNRSRREGVVQGAFPCRGEDKWIAISLRGDDETSRFAALANLPGLPHIEPGPRHADDAEALIGGFTATQDNHELAGRLQKVGIEAFPVMTAFDLVADPHLAERGYFVQPSGYAERFVLPGFPARSDRTFADPHGQAPRFGEHGGAIRDWLGDLSGGGEHEDSAVQSA